GSVGSALSTHEDIVAAVTHDERLAAWTVRRQGDGFLELEVGRLSRNKGPIIAVLVWPQVWRDAVRFAPHLVRARSGNYSLLLVGDDAAFATAQVDRLADDGDVAAIVVPTSIARLALALRARAET